MDATAGIANVSRLRMLADGLRDAGSVWQHRVHMEIWPILNRRQVERMGPDVRTFLGSIADSIAPMRPTSGFDDARAAIRELEAFAGDGALRNRRGLQRLGPLSIETADRIDAALVGMPDDAASLAASRAALFDRIGAEAADLTSEQATELLPLLPPSIAGRQAQTYLGLSSPEHATEFVRTMHKIVDRSATTADRERLALIELIGRRTPEGDERLRAIALKIFETDPAELKPAAWKRLATLLELDSAARVLDGPRDFGGSARPLDQAANRIARQIQFAGSARTGSVTRRYFEQWREALRAHPGADGAPLRPDRRSPNVERMFQVKPPEAKQLVADLGRVGSSNFDDIRTALGFVDDRLDFLGDDAPELASKITETRTLVAKNQRRLGGNLHDGYGRHPDYAELGRIRSNVELIESIVATKESRAADAVKAADAAATTGETLTW